MMLLLLKTNLPDLHYSLRNIQTLLTIHFIFLEKATVEFMFHMVLGKSIKIIYNSTLLMDVMLKPHGQTALTVTLPITLEPTTTSKV